MDLNTGRLNTSVSIEGGYSDNDKYNVGINYNITNNTFRASGNYGDIGLSYSFNDRVAGLSYKSWAKLKYDFNAGDYYLNLKYIDNEYKNAHVLTCSLALVAGSGYLAYNNSDSLKNRVDDY